MRRVRVAVPVSATGGGVADTCGCGGSESSRSRNRGSTDCGGALRWRWSGVKGHLLLFPPARSISATAARRNSCPTSRVVGTNEMSSTPARSASSTARSSPASISTLDRRVAHDQTDDTGRTAHASQCCKARAGDCAREASPASSNCGVRAGPRHRLHTLTNS
jgi:hypothetical protein